MIALLLLALSLPTAAQDAADQVVVARAAGLPLSRGAFEDWLFERQGNERIMDFAVEHVLDQRAQALGVLPSPEQVEQAYLDEVQHVVDSVFKGDHEAYLANLKLHGETPEEHHRRRLPDVRQHTICAAIARTLRVVDDAAVAQRFLEIYGSGSETTRLEVLFFSGWKDKQQEGAEIDLAARRKQAGARAAAARQRLAAGEAFEAVRADSEPPASNFVKAGIVRAWRRDLLGHEVHLAVEQLDSPGDMSQPIETWDGAWLVRLVSRAPVTLDQARAEIRQELLDAPVDAAEVAKVRLEAEPQVEVLLR